MCMDGFQINSDDSLDADDHNIRKLRWNLKLNLKTIKHTTKTQNHKQDKYKLQRKIKLNFKAHIPILYSLRYNSNSLGSL
jgi:hypothetical protein